MLAMDFSESIQPYQQLAVDFLLDGDHRALFAGMGLGKTAASLKAIQHLLCDGAIRGALVVAPLRVCNITWPKEVAKWEDMSWLEVANLRTAEGRKAYERGTAHIYVINYESLPAFCQKYMDGRKPPPFDLIIWDEISRAKNPSSVRVNAMRKHWGRIRYHWGLTGTPSPNSKLDVFAQYRLLDGGTRLGQSFFHFRQTYFYATDYEQHHWVQRKEQREVLEQRVADMTLVLKSSEFLDIPDTVVEDVEVALPDHARAIYKKLARELYVMIEHQEIEAINAAVLVNKLLQVTSGSVYNSPEDPTQREVVELHDAKVKALQRVIRAQEGAPLLVAYQFQHERDRLMRAIPGAVDFSSATTSARQNEMVDAWNAGLLPVLLAHPASMGHGLNLQDGGTDICWFSLTWSRELYDQLNARLARMGQTRITRIFRLTCPNTMDDAVAESLKVKGDEQTALMDAIHNFRMLGDPGRVTSVDEETLNLFQQCVA